MHFSLSDCILDLVQNSLEANSATVGLTLSETIKSLNVIIEDDGKGMDEEELKRATDPFYTDGLKHKHRKVGLGLPFLIQTVAMSDGKFEIQSTKGKGTKLEIIFNLENMDCPPIGDLVSLFYQLISYGGDHEMKISRSLGEQGNTYTVSRREMSEVLGDLDSLESLSLLRDFISSQEEELNTGD